MVSSVFTHVPLFILKLRINIKIKNFYKSFYVIFAGSSKEIALQVLICMMLFALIKIFYQFCYVSIESLLVDSPKYEF